MSLRFKFTLYLIALHAIFGVAAYLLLGERRVWLLAVEGFFVVSLTVGLYLVRALFEPLRLLRSGEDFIREKEFTTRILEVGQPELDPLIRVYNRMVDNLREERIRSEEQEHFLQKIITASPSGVLALDLDGRITMANPSAEGLLKLSHQRLLGSRLDELGLPLADRLADLQADQTRLITVQGRRRVRCRALHFMDRGFARRFILMDELTEELHRSERAAYEKLIRMMSHEVNNTTGAVNSLLNTCLGYGDHVPAGSREEFTEALSVAIARTDRMNQFMQEFAEVVRLPAPKKQPCDLRKLLEEVALLLKSESERRHIRWRWEVDGSLPTVQCDTAQMEQALLNICKNGLEAIGSDGILTVRMEVDRGRPCVVVRDSGLGIPEEIREHLFTPFFTSKENGQGIGLTLVQEILLGHGCDFSLDNAEGEGAEFGIWF